MKRMGILIAASVFFLLAHAAQAIDWAVSQRLCWNSGASYAPAIAVESSGNLHVVWHDSTPGNVELYYIRSTDGGATWVSSQRITWTSGISCFPALSVDPSGNPHVVWQDNTWGDFEIYYKSSTDGGATWGIGKRLTSNAADSSNPAIAVDSSGYLYAAWQDDRPGNYEIYYKKSIDSGDHWAPDWRLTWTSGDSTYPAIAVDPSDCPHALWRDETPGNPEIYYRKSMNGGLTWSASKRLTTNAGFSSNPAIAVDSSGYLYAAWQDDRPGNYEVFYKKSIDSGGHWSPDSRLTWTSGDSRYPAIAVDSSDNPYVFWQDETPGNFEIYCRNSTNGGLTWTAGVRLTSTPGESLVPAVAADAAGNLHLVWSDDTPGNYEVHYMKGTPDP